MHTSSSTHDSTEQLLGATVEEREREFNGSCFSLRHSSISIIVLYILESAHFLWTIYVVCQPRKDTGMLRNAIYRVCYAHGVHKVQVIECIPESWVLIDRHGNTVWPNMAAGE